MAERPQLYKHFGPELIQAMIAFMVEQLNLVRSFHELQQLTEPQVEATIQNKFNELTADLELPSPWPLGPKKGV